MKNTQKAEKFLSFLESLKGNGQDKLIEIARTAFEATVSAEDIGDYEDNQPDDNLSERASQVLVDGLKSGELRKMTDEWLQSSNFTHDFVRQVAFKYMESKGINPNDNSLDSGGVFGDAFMEPSDLITDALMLWLERAARMYSF